MLVLVRLLCADCSSPLEEVEGNPCDNANMPKEHAHCRCPNVECASRKRMGDYSCCVMTGLEQRIKLAPGESRHVPP